MATWTDFELQQALRQMQPNGGSQNIGGYWVSPQYGNQYWEGQGENSQQVAGAPTEYQVTKDLGKGKNGILGGGGSAQYENAAYDRYGADGQFLGTDKYKDMGTDSFTKAMAYLAAAGGAAVGASALAPSLAAGGGAGSMTNGAFLGEAAWAPTAGSVPLEFGAATTGLTEGGGLLSKAALDGTTAFGANSIPGALDITALNAAAPGAASAAEVANIAKSLGYAGAPAGATSFLQSLPDAVKSMLPASMKDLLGPAMTLVGAAAGTGGGGSGGGGGGRTLDPRMEAYLYDANGLMPMTQGLLQRQAPIAEQNGQLLGDRARGLLGRGVATNPFLRG